MPEPDGHRPYPERNWTSIPRQPRSIKGLFARGLLRAKGRQRAPTVMIIGSSGRPAVAKRKRRQSPDPQLESAVGEQSSACRAPAAQSPTALTKVGDLKNRTLPGMPGRTGFVMRKSLAAAAVALAVTAGMLTPAGPALAGDDPKPALTAPATPGPKPASPPTSAPKPAAPATTQAAGTSAAGGANGTLRAQPQQTTVPGVFLFAWSASPDTDRAKVFKLSGQGFAGGTASLQRLAAGAWTTVRTTPVLKKDNATLTYTFQDEGTAKFRTVLNRAGKKLATSTQQTVAYARQQTYVQAGNSWTNNPFSTAEGRVSAGTQWSTTYTVYYALGDRRGSLQEYRNGLWRTVQTVDFTRASGWKATVKSPLVNATTSKRYRFTVAATAKEKSWTSGSTVIAHMNPADYTGYKKAAYDYMKPYCDKQVITLIGGFTSFAWYPSYRIEMAQTYGTGKSLQYVALHECAHIASFKLYNDDAKLTARMNAIYGSWPAGKEQLADCMAYAMGADKNYGGSYTRDCSGYRGTAARKVLAGQKP